MSRFDITKIIFVSSCYDGSNTTAITFLLLTVIAFKASYKIRFEKSQANIEVV